MTKQFPDQYLPFLRILYHLVGLKITPTNEFIDPSNTSDNVHRVTKEISDKSNYYVITNYDVTG